MGYKSQRTRVYRGKEFEKKGEKTRKFYTQRCRRVNCNGISAYTTNARARRSRMAFEHAVSRIWFVYSYVLLCIQRYNDNGRGASDTLSFWTFGLNVEFPFQTPRVFPVTVWGRGLCRYFCDGAASASLFFIVSSFFFSFQWDISIRYTYGCKQRS